MQGLICFINTAQKQPTLILYRSLRQIDGHKAWVDSNILDIWAITLAVACERESLRDKQINYISVKTRNILLYYINTNEIPSELSRENLISSHVKITCYLQGWKYHRCYGYIINPAFPTRKLLKWNGLVFHWCLYNK